MECSLDICRELTKSQGFVPTKQLDNSKNLVSESHAEFLTESGICYCLWNKSLHPHRHFLGHDTSFWYNWLWRGSLVELSKIANIAYDDKDLST